MLHPSLKSPQNLTKISEKNPKFVQKFKVSKIF
jgi:hypothetical protein